MKPKNGEWLVYPSPSESVAGVTTIYTGHDRHGNMVGQIGEVYGSDKNAQAIAKLMASAPELLEEIKDVKKWILDFRNNVSIENAIKISNRSIRITDLITKVEGK